jgi:hypothetical protein
MRRAGDVGHVPLFAPAPGRFRFLVGVAVAGHDVGYLGAEPLADLCQSRLSALILGGVVQEGCDDLVLGPAVLAAIAATASRCVT